MKLSDRIEWLLESAAAGTWPDLDTRDLEVLNGNYIPDHDLTIPYQWILIREQPRRGLNSLRKMATELQEGCEALLALLDTIDQAEKEAEEAGRPEWARYLTLLRAPFTVQKPEIADPGDVDTVRLVVHDIVHGGSWDHEIEWTEREGSREQKEEDLPVTRGLKAFEETYGVKLTDLLFTEEDRQTNAALRQAFEEGGMEGMQALSDSTSRPRPGQQPRGPRRPRRSRRGRKRRR